MRRFFAMLRYSKKLFVLSICLGIELLLVLGLCIFDVVQLIQVTRNSVLISNAFMTLNIILISLLAVNLIAVVVFAVIEKIKIKQGNVKDEY